MSTHTLAQHMVDLERLIATAERRGDWAEATELAELREHTQKVRSWLVLGWRGRDDSPVRGAA